MEQEQLTKIRENLPATVDELREFILVGRERLKAYQAKVIAIDNISLAETVREAALYDAQDFAEVLIYAEAKLGELLAAIEPKRIRESSSQSTSLPHLPPGIDKRMSHQAQTLARNLPIVERVVAETKERGEIPTPDKTYKLIKREEALAKVDEIRKHAVAPPAGKYSVIVIDPPWPMEKIERDVRPNQHGFDYPTMSEEELLELDIPAADDCHLFLWTTQRFLPMGRNASRRIRPRS